MPKLPSSDDESLRRLSPDELWELRSVSPSAREELIRRNLPLARSLAARYRNVNEPLDDLVQIASLGLVKAVDRFDPRLGRPFSSYATPTILGELRRHFRDTGWSAHVPRGAQELALRVQNAVEQLTDLQHRSPTVLELAAYLELDTEAVLQALEAAEAHFAASMDAPLTGPGGDDSEPATLHDHTGRTDSGYSLVETSSALADGIARLPYGERQALVLRLQDDLSQAEIAKVLGCSQMRVSRLLRRAAERLRQELDPDQTSGRPES